MSGIKASARSRPLENHRPLPVLRAADLDIEDDALVDRSAPHMPTGMEKEEEEEIHLQEIMKQQMTANIDAKEVAAIPIPEIVNSDLKTYEKIYPSDFQLPNNEYIRATDRIDVDPPPQYDRDDEDAEFIQQFNKDPSLVAKNSGSELEDLRFEVIIDIFEMAQEQIAEGGGLISLEEAVSILADEPEYSIAETIYAYWARRAKDRLTVMYRTKKAVIVNGQQLQSSEGDPYVAFRAHRARMQTRRNRKSEEQNYEKMIKLRRDFDQLRQLCLWTRQRELAKQELQDVNYKTFKMEYDLGEWKHPRKEKAITKFRLKLNPQKAASSSQTSKPANEKRNLGKMAAMSSGLSSLESEAFFRKYGRFVHIDMGLDASDEEGALGDGGDTEEDIDTMIGNACDIFNVFENSINSFRMKRKKGCRYHETLDSLYVPKDEGWREKPHSAFRDMSFGAERVRFGRRRVGRGGRLWFDRRLPTYHDARRYDDNYIQVEPNVMETGELRWPQQLDEEKGNIGSHDLKVDGAPPLATPPTDTGQEPGATGDAMEVDEFRPTAVSSVG